ncbi:MAG: DUF302 domain-containing protein [Hyphomicrobiaceae bacterium]
MLLLAAAALSAASGGEPALAGDLVVKQSRHSVKETIDALAALLEKKGIAVAARVDHAAGARAAGLALPPTELLIFGNPKLGTPLMQANPEMGIDLPMKVLAWQDAAGNVKVAYTRPAALAGRHGVDGQDAVLQQMEKALSTLTDAAAGLTP